MNLQKTILGTSGWHYAHWRGNFYPSSLAPADFLVHYASQFSSVELDGTFYRLPTDKAVDSWYETSPKGFVFAAKASRFLTHMKKLKDPKDPLRRIYHWTSRLREKMGPILFQLPPHWGFNALRLQEFLSVLSKDFRYAIEFREPSWFNEQAYELLAQKKIALCLYDLAGVPSPQKLTSDFTYFRFHGPQPKYQGSYTDEQLADWTKTFQQWAPGLKKMYVYFNNDPQGHAPRNARMIREQFEALDATEK